MWHYLESGWVNNSWARTTDELATTLEDLPTTYLNSQLGRSHRSIVHGGQSGFNSCIEATKTYLTGNLQSLPPSTFMDVSFVARSSPRNENWRFERLGGCGFSTWTGTNFIMTHPGTAHTLFFMNHAAASQVVQRVVVTSLRTSSTR